MMKDHEIFISTIFLINNELLVMRTDIDLFRSVFGNDFGESCI